MDASDAMARRQTGKYGWILETHCRSPATRPGRLFLFLFGASLLKQRQKRQFKDAAKKLQKNMNRTMRRQPSLGPAIVISDSEDEDDPMNATVIPVSVAAPSLPPTPPADTTTCSDPGICGPSLFYESRLPNNGKDKQPVYADAPSAGMLNMHGMSFTLPSQNDSIGDRPASTPVDEPKPSAFDYSLISDTSLQVTATADTLNCSGDLDFITLDDTLVAGSGEEPTIPRTLVPRGEPGKKVDASLEDGEIIDVETEDSLDDSVVFVSEGVLTPKNKSRMVRNMICGRVLDRFVPVSVAAIEEGQHGANS